jgi:hypothetical protein
LSSHVPHLLKAVAFLLCDVPFLFHRIAFLTEVECRCVCACVCAHSFAYSAAFQNDFFPSTLTSIMRFDHIQALHSCILELGIISAYTDTNIYKCIHTSASPFLASFGEI